jgi:hypothetical protein
VLGQAHRKLHGLSTFALLVVVVRLVLAILPLMRLRVEVVQGACYQES